MSKHDAEEVAATTVVVINQQTPALAGGRYDGLLKALWPPGATAAGPAPSAVGLSVNVDRLVDLYELSRTRDVTPGPRGSQAPLLSMY